MATKKSKKRLAAQISLNTKAKVTVPWPPMYLCVSQEGRLDMVHVSEFEPEVLVQVADMWRDKFFEQARGGKCQ